MENKVKKYESGKAEIIEHHEKTMQSTKSLQLRPLVQAYSANPLTRRKDKIPTRAIIESSRPRTRRIRVPKPNKRKICMSDH